MSETREKAARKSGVFIETNNATNASSVDGKSGEGGDETASAGVNRPVFFNTFSIAVV